MKSTHTKFLLIGAFLASIIFLGVGAAPAAKQSGSDRYIPTKREWLMVTAEADAAGSPSFTVIHFRAGKDADTVLLECDYSAKVNREHMNRAMALHRRTLEGLAKAKGWTWLNIKEGLYLLKD